MYTRHTIENSSLIPFEGTRQKAPVVTFLKWEILQKEVISSLGIKERVVSGPKTTKFLKGALVYLVGCLNGIGTAAILLRTNPVFILVALHLCMGLACVYFLIVTP